MAKNEDKAPEAPEVIKAQPLETTEATEPTEAPKVEPKKTTRKNLKKELAGKKNDVGGYTGYIRARIKAGK